MQNRAEQSNVSPGGQPGLFVLPGLATDGRLVSLALRACLLAAGVVPWLVWAVYVLVAAGQEPPLLRSFGIHLVPEAVGLASGLLLIVLSAHLRAARRLLPFVAAVAALTVGIALLASGTAAVLELVRHGPFRGIVTWRAAPVFSLTFFPTAVCACLVANRPTLGRLLHGSAQAVLAMTWLVRSTAVDWPSTQIVATMACSVSAVAAAANYCKQKS